MGNLTIATIFVVMLNVMMFFGTTAMAVVNPTGTFCYHTEGSVIGESIIGDGNSSSLNNNVEADLPEVAGNLFTDVFNNALSWFKSAPGLKYVYGVVAAPYNILKCLNLPNAFVVGVGTLWYIVNLIILVAFFWGRD